MNLVLCLCCAVKLLRSKVIADPTEPSPTNADEPMLTMREPTVMQQPIEKPNFHALAPLGNNVRRLGCLELGSHMWLKALNDNWTHDPWSVLRHRYGASAAQNRRHGMAAVSTAMQKP